MTEPQIPAPRGLAIKPDVQIGELNAQLDWWKNRCMILAQLLDDALGIATAHEETIKQRDTEIARSDTDKNQLLAQIAAMRAAADEAAIGAPDALTADDDVARSAIDRV